MILSMGFLCLAVSACTLPRIIELKDPLSAEEHNDLGVAYEQKGRLDLAEKEYKTSRDKRTDWAIPHFNMGNLYVRMGEIRKAEDSYRKALVLNGSNPDILNNLAYLLYQKGNIEEAKKLINRALAVSRKKEFQDTHDRILNKAESRPY